MYKNARAMVALLRGQMIDWIHSPRTLIMGIIILLLTLLYANGYKVMLQSSDLFSYFGESFYVYLSSGFGNITLTSAMFLDTVDKSVVLWYNEEKRTGVFLHGEQLSTARYVRCDVGNSQAVHNRKQGNVGRERKGYPSISEWRVLDFENGSTMERPAAGIW